MTKTPEALFILSPHLNDIDNGVFSLSCPTYQGNIQIGTKSPKEFTKLHIEKDDSCILIAREDAEPVQIEIVKTKSLAFAKSIGELVLVRESSTDTSGRWWGVGSLLEDVEVTDQQGLFEFTNLVGGFIDKRQREQKAAKLSKLLIQNIRAQKNLNNTGNLN